MISLNTFQVKSKLLVSFRSRQVEVFVPEFVPEAEQQLLGAALKQWQNSAEGAVASSALDMQVAEQHLRQTAYRYSHLPCLSEDQPSALKSVTCCCGCRLFQDESTDAKTLQTLLEHFLTVAEDISQSESGCPAAVPVVQELALYTGSQFLTAAHDSALDSSAAPLCQLVQILTQHPQQAHWAVTLLHVAAEDIPALLSALLNQSKVSMYSTLSQSMHFASKVGRLAWCCIKA